MSSEPPVPRWLWRATVWGLGALLFGVTALAIALYGGLADPPRAGPLLWQETFKADLSRWQFGEAGGARLVVQDGALVATFTGPDQIVFAVAEAPLGDFTLEIAAAPTEGDNSTRYGLVFDWDDERHYSAVLITATGYVEAYRQNGATRTDWFPFAQWPHLLYGTEANRVRVDVRGAQVSARINDEVLMEKGSGDRPGRKLGVLARSVGPGRIVFGWIGLWAASNR